MRINITGMVQGVGFRPLVYRLARALSLRGWVRNNNHGVDIELEGNEADIKAFVDGVDNEASGLAYVDKLSSIRVGLKGYDAFNIVGSDDSGNTSMCLTPDMVTCTECLREVLDKTRRRYLYPFTSCSHCGPRWSIIETLPYDRARTTMSAFELCRECSREYQDPGNRRFHHQANACPACGPKLSFTNKQQSINDHGDALAAAVSALQQGRIICLKGVGGYQLLVDAGNESAVRRLRKRKQRAAKALAIMCKEISQVDDLCLVTPPERELLESAAGPIVLLKTRAMDEAVSERMVIADAVAPGTPYLGVMLPTSTLHYLLVDLFGSPLVVTSGNRSGEALCFKNTEAREQLSNIADGFLIHNREIAQPVDDSVAQVACDKPMLLRRARGYSAQLRVKGEKFANGDTPLLAVGAHQKITIALAGNAQIGLSAHIGNLGGAGINQYYEDRIESFKTLHKLEPGAIIRDLHEDYQSTLYAESQGLPSLAVQHHHAHLVACMYEHDIEGTILGAVWDGAGRGDDGSLWGGEFLLADYESYTRVAHLKPFSLPGGERAARDTRRTALAILWSVFYQDHEYLAGTELYRQLSGEEQDIFIQMLDKGINTCQTSSAGRLFDAMASLLGLCNFNRYEGEAAMSLQFAAERSKLLPGAWSEARENIQVKLSYENDRVIADWRQMFKTLYLWKNERSAEDLALLFHVALADLIARLALQTGQERIILTGGCFQNRLLLSLAVSALREKHINVYWPQMIPANDGGIAMGQVIAGTQRLASKGAVS